MELLIGADPEFFVKKDGKFVSAHGLVEGTKANPLKVEGGAVQVDGAALEINIDPAATFEKFESNFQKVTSTIREMVGPEYEFAYVPVADFDEEDIKNWPEEARRLGCDPDFNAWTGKPNNPPDGNKNFRTASGHFHLGWTENEDIKNPEFIDACEMMVKQLDASIGLMGVVYDGDIRRRELYGKAGAYRPKPYGVEYRVLSNFWLGNYSQRKELFDTIRVSFNHLIDGIDYTKQFGKKIQQYINTGDFEFAYETVGYNVQRSGELRAAYINRRTFKVDVQQIVNEPVKKRARARKIAAGPVDVAIAGFGGRNMIVDDFVQGGWIMNNNAAPPAPPVAPVLDPDWELDQLIRDLENPANA